MALNCYHCLEPGHFAANCQLTAVAGSHAEHMARIDRFVARWADHELTTEQKRRLISDENQLYYGAACPPRLIWRNALSSDISRLYWDYVHRQSARRVHGERAGQARRLRPGLDQAARQGSSPAFRGEHPHSQPVAGTPRPARCTTPGGGQ